MLELYVMLLSIPACSMLAAVAAICCPSYQQTKLYQLNI